jgi:hypothetical protein
LLCRSLAQEIETNKPLAPEDQRRVEMAIRNMAGLISDGVRLLGPAKLEASVSSNSPSESEYDQIENAGKTPLLLSAASTEHDPNKPSASGK